MNCRTAVTICVLFLLPGAAAGNEPRTPLESANYASLSSYDDMMRYLRTLDSNSDVLTMTIIGQSVENRDIPALFFSLDPAFGSQRGKKPVVLIYCQQHGNEPSGKEGALVTARRLANDGQAILQKLDLILVPQVNPDGAEMGQRKNANDMDLNRNHVILSEPESFALHRLFLRWLPEVTLDVHEYNAIKKAWISHGLVKDADEMLGGVTNLNVAPEIISFARETIIPAVGQTITEDGFRFFRYIVGEPFENHRIRYSTTAINDGRQSMGIHNTFSFIIEGKRYGDLLTNIERRTKGQASAMMAFLKTVANHAAEIVPIIRVSRHRLASPEEQKKDVVIQMDYFRDPARPTLKFPVFDLYTWHHIEKELENYYPVVKTIASVTRPFAYIFPARETKLIDLLQKHQIDLYQVEAEQEIEVTTYTILHVTPAVDEDKPTERVDVSREKQRMTIAPGSIAILLEQRAANLISLMLEPQSTWSIVKTRAGRKYRFSQYLQEGHLYPIYRVEKPVNLALQKIPSGEMTKR